MKRRLLAVLTAVFLMMNNYSDITFAQISDIRGVKSNSQTAEQGKRIINEKPFSMVWFTDTQYYAESYPEIFDFLGDLLVKEYKKGSFGYVINTGDLVNVASDIRQWEVADRNFKKLDTANVPYGVLAGNHDVSINGLNYQIYNKYFGKSRFKAKSWYGGNMSNNLNHYDLITLGGHDFIILYLDYSTNITEETIKWSNNILKKYSGRTAILAMHEYLNCNSSLTYVAHSVFNRIISKNSNVIMVLCGHNHCAVRRIKTVINTDGSTRKVIEILSDYQKAPHGGDGYLRYLNFHPESGLLQVVTYSPYKNKYNFFEDTKDSFTEKIKLID
ncbi:metallophosphoesterase [Ruminiclostridium cellobioparum]|uniref:metallophosphoesterase n=1 Tax=Ruminiclostridium cellobioparum TaxID=29355 RepID=UPI0028B1F214|nr:metallophosphoesterase [Ruminiclostridium cellobioparum]